MIKVSELRIGNLIFDDEGIISKVVGFKPYDHSIRCDEEEGCDLIINNYSQDGVMRGPYELDSNLFEPIPLDPDWLKKCGFSFTVSETVSYFIPIGDKLRIEFDEAMVCGLAFEMWDRRVRITIIAEIKYLHQLQNLYNSHTGNELEIKL